MTQDITCLLHNKMYFILKLSFNNAVYIHQLLCTIFINSQSLLTKFSCFSNHTIKPKTTNSDDSLLIKLNLLPKITAVQK